jgi:hypothetical protein
VSSDEALRSAECSCAQLRAEVRGAPRSVTVCHCYACQRRSGSVFAAQACFSRENVRIQGEASLFERRRDEGGLVRFYFCPRCGATVYYDIEGRDDVRIIPVGAFADSSFPAPGLSVWEERCHPWVRMPEGIQRMD